MGIRYEEVLGKVRVLGFDKGFTANDLKIAGIVDGKPVTEIADNAFSLTNISSIYLPATIEIVGRHAFENCKNLTSVSVGDIEQEVADVLTIRKDAFNGCSNLSSVNAWSDIVSVECYAFANCKSLSFVTMGIINLGEYAFHNCPQLYSLDFEEGAVLQENCLNDCGVEKIRTISNITVHPNTLKQIKDKNVKIYCVSESNLVNLAYEGYYVEIYPEYEELVLLGH